MSALTWSALLGGWIEFARSALALPDDRAGRRLREAVADIIMLQAVWFALGQLDDLPADERALGRDRAAVLIEKHEGALRSRWADEPVPEQLETLIRDARQRLTAAPEADASDVGPAAPSDAG